MQSMQYDISLPADYDMKIIKKRVTENGSKTDNFKDLLFKAYLITEKEMGSLANSYAPLYVWKDTDGMNKFIFKGFYDNIIQSFGWQSIKTGITQKIDLDNNEFTKSKFVLENIIDITPRQSLNNFQFDVKTYPNEVGKVIIYNPEKWQYTTFTFLKDKPKYTIDNQKLYTLLHLSLGE